MQHISPLRYPGGKFALAGYLSNTIEANDLRGCKYYEPFAGGAGAGLRLLMDEVASELHLNDLDPCITAFWNAVLNEPRRFQDAILTTPVNVDEWRIQAEVVRRKDTSKSFELGFATFYLNRCNRSGVVSGAAPIGGYSQTGAWKLDARFYRERLAERVQMIAERREDIRVTNLEARAFLKSQLPRVSRRSKVFVYLDPPYFSKGSRLYLNYYREAEHRSLAGDLRRRKAMPWMMSYDDCSLIRGLYSFCSITQNAIQYSLQHKQAVKELLIAPYHVQMPQVVELSSASSTS